MNQTLETILTRRSTRKFLRKPIPEEEMELIVQAALHAPSAKGLQTWQFTVVRNREKIQKLATAIREVLEAYHREYRCSYLLITHDMKFAYSLSQRIYELERGQIIRIGQSNIDINSKNPKERT